MSVGNPLDAMADVLRRDGWIRLQSESPDGRRCLLGCWKHCYQYGSWSSDVMLNALEALRDVCAEQYGTGLVAEVNDRHIDDADQAIALLEKASARFAEVHG